MNNHEKLVDLCTQVVEASTVRNEEANECYCPFCENTGYFTNDLDHIIHEEGCAYLVAVQVLEENKTSDVRICYTTKK
jgi:hypothetical protein